MQESETGDPKHQIREKEEKILAQIYVAFGQGTGEIRVARGACNALCAQALPRLEALQAGWDTDAVQILERVRAMGRSARQRAVMRFDTVVRAQDVELVAAQVMAVSATPACPGPVPLRGPQTPMEIIVESQKILIGEHTFSLPSSGGQLSAALGKPREIDKPGAPNHLLVWDSLGLIAYQSNATSMVEALVLFILSLPDRPISPSGLTGPLTVAGVKIGASSTLDFVGHEILRKGGSHVSRLGTGFWTLKYGDFHITLEQAESPTIETVTISLPK